ncbi:hypothetical protein DsansV1_C03g0029621 [Dioscorea sansibarensis]
MGMENISNVSYILGLLVKRLSTPNSNVKVPPPAVDLALLSFSSTPRNRLTDPYGIPAKYLFLINQN